MLADEAGAILGHVAVSAVRLSPATALKAGQVAPLCVDPRCHRRGYGSQLIHAAIEDARRLGLDVLFVLGDPAYYGRLGFEQCDIQSAYGPSEYYRACFLRDGPHQDLAGFEATLSRAFAGLE